MPSGAKLLAGDQGFEPCNAGFGVRRSASRACLPWCAPLDLNQHSAALKAGASAVGPGALGAGGERRTRKLSILNRADMPILLRRQNNVWWPSRDSNSHPEGLVPKTSAAANYARGPQPGGRCRTRTCVDGDRRLVYSQEQLPLMRNAQNRIVNERAGEPATRTLVSRGSAGLADQLGGLLPMLSENKSF